MRRNIINNKIANVTLALLVSTAYVTGAMEGGDDQLAEAKGHPDQSENIYSASEEAKGTGTLQAQIRAKVAMILKGFEDRMNAYYEQTGNSKRILIAPELIDTQEKQHEQFEDGAEYYCEARLQETGVIYKSPVTEIKWALKHYPFTETTGAVATMILENMEKEIAPKLEAQAKAKAGEIKDEMLNNDQQRQAEKIAKQTAQERLEAEKAKVELRRQEQLRKAEEARQQLAQHKEKAEPSKSDMLSKDQQNQPSNAKKQTAQEKLEAERAKAELRRQEQLRKAEEARQQLAQRKEKAEPSKSDMLNKSQQGQSAQGQTAQEKLAAEKAKVELRKQEQLRKAQEARRQVAQRKAEAEAAKVGMRKQEQQNKVDIIQDLEGQ